MSIVRCPIIAASTSIGVPLSACRWAKLWRNAYGVTRSRGNDSPLGPISSGRSRTQRRTAQLNRSAPVGKMPSGFSCPARKQPQLRQRRCREAGDDPLALRDDQLGGRLRDEQPKVRDRDLRHVVHQHPAALQLARLLIDELGAVQARRHQLGQLVRATAGVGQHLQHHEDVLAVSLAQPVEIGVGEQLIDHHLRQRPTLAAGILIDAPLGHVLHPDRELGAQPVQRLARLKQPEVAALDQELAHPRHAAVIGRVREPARAMKPTQTLDERPHVTASQRRPLPPAVLAQRPATPTAAPPCARAPGCSACPYTSFATKPTAWRPHGANPALIGEKSSRRFRTSVTSPALRRSHTSETNSAFRVRVEHLELAQRHPPNHQHRRADVVGSPIELHQ